MKYYLMDGTKLLWHQDRLKEFMEGRKIMPIHIDMGIIKSCNINCIYCYGVKQIKSPKRIPTDRLLMLAEDAKEAGIKSLAIIGDGEPTLNLGLYHFVRKLKILRVDCSVATNGLLLQESQIKILTNSCTWLRFNISGVEKYNKIMGARLGSFGKFENIVKYAVAHKKDCTIGLQMVLVPDNFSEIIPLAKKAVEWKVDYLVIKQFSDGGAGMPMHFNMDKYYRAGVELEAAEAMSNRRTKIIVKWHAINETIHITKLKQWDFDRCIDLPFLFQISGDGGCYPCGFLFGNKDYCYGNVNSQRLIDILHSDRYWDIIKKVAHTPLKNLCKGQCRHCANLKFLDKLTKIYHGNLQMSLWEMHGGVQEYHRKLKNPPQHINFI